MRRTLLSCTSLARHGLLGLVSTLLASGTASAAELSLAEAISALNHQEFAVLTTALALLGFSVVAAILLMRNRTRAAKNENKLKSEIGELQAQTDRLRALLFAEPQVLISWPAGEDRPRISGDISLLLPPDQQQTPQRILAFGSWLPPEPALQIDHAVDALREKGEGFLLNLATSTGRAVEAMGRAIAGQAIVRIRELSGVRRELAEANLRFRTLQEETELLSDFAAAAPWPIWAKGARGELRYVNAGHPPIVVWGSTREPVWLGSTGPLVSPVIPRFLWQLGVAPVEAGDHLLLYTDGVSEVLADADGCAKARLTNTIDRASAAGGSLLDAILAEVQHELAGAPQPDDLTLLTARILG